MMALQSSVTHTDMRGADHSQEFTTGLADSGTRPQDRCACGQKWSGVARSSRIVRPPA